MVETGQTVELVIRQEPEIEEGLGKLRVDGATGELDEGGEGEAELGQFAGEGGGEAGAAGGEGWVVGCGLRGG